MLLEAPFRPAVREDCPRIAELFSVSSGGVAEVVWSRMDAEYPGLTPVEIGARRYAREDIPFSYQNCVVSDIGGDVVGMMNAFPIPEELTEASADPEVPSEDRVAEPDVLAPYDALEVPGSYYICGIAILPEHRGKGLGTRFVEIAGDRARELSLKTVSLIAFEQNPGAVELYRRLGFREVDRRAVVPHPFIRYTGDALLMTAEV